MLWIGPFLLVVLVVVLTRSFVRNAVALHRDVNERFDEIRVRLEREANSTVDAILNAKRDDGPA